MDDPEIDLEMTEDVDQRHQNCLPSSANDGHPIDEFVFSLDN